MEAKYYRCTMIATKSKIYVAKVQRKCNVKFALQKEICGDIIQKMQYKNLNKAGTRT